MKFLIDADTPYSLMKIFEKYRYEVVHVNDILKFAVDEKIFEYAKKNNYVIVTKDLGFAEMLFKNKGASLILIRLPYYFTAEKINRNFEEFLKEVNLKELVDSITVVELGKYRIKKL